MGRRGRGVMRYQPVAPLDSPLGRGCAAGEGVRVDFGAGGQSASVRPLRWEWVRCGGGLRLGPLPAPHKGGACASDLAGAIVGRGVAVVAGAADAPHDTEGARVDAEEGPAALRVPLGADRQGVCCPPGRANVRAGRFHLQPRRRRTLTCV